MKLFIYVMTISFIGISLQAGVMPEETSNSVLETVIGFIETLFDYSSDVVEPTLSFKEKVEDFLHFTFMTLYVYLICIWSPVIAFFVTAAQLFTSFYNKICITFSKWSLDYFTT